MNYTDRADNWTQQERQQLIDAIESIEGPCDEIYLVGSRIIGWHRESSDYDVVIERPDESRSGQRVQYQDCTLSIMRMPRFSNHIAEVRDKVDDSIVFEGVRLPYLKLKEGTVHGIEDDQIQIWLTHKRNHYRNFDAGRSFDDLINEGDMHVE